jgi:oligopeptide/dipeptide ABC transporter ATP-binding protein
MGISPEKQDGKGDRGGPLLKIEDLTLDLVGETGTRGVLDRVSFEVFPDEVMGLVGESGSGKTLSSLAITRLLPAAARVTGGKIYFGSQDLLKLNERAMRKVRGSQIAMIFQNPRTALNPVMRAGDQVARAVRLHRRVSKAEAYESAVNLLKHVGISDAPVRARSYPHQLSGGMAQRVLTAMMLACKPELLIADEPTTGLDVTIQAQIFELIKSVQAETGASLLLITHDLGVVAEVCKRVAVMYAGQVMEVAPVEQLFAQPKHPYTCLLLGSVLRVDKPTNLSLSDDLNFNVRYDISGCRFANRCPKVMPKCWTTRPAPVQVGPGQTVICHLYSGEAA